MALEVGEFIQQIREGMREPHRYLPGSPIVQGINKGTVTPEQLRKLTVQVYLHTREIGRAYAFIYGNCPDPEVRKGILYSFVEEETGFYSKTGMHIDYLVTFGEALGIKADEIVNGRPSKVNALLIDWMHFVTKNSSFVDGLAFFRFGDQGEAFRLMAEGFRRHYRVNDDAMMFWDLHLNSSDKPKATALQMVAFERYCATDQAQDRVREVALRAGEYWFDMWNDALNV